MLKLEPMPQPAYASTNPVADWVRALSAMKDVEGERDVTLLSDLRGRTAKQLDRMALIGENQRLSYRELFSRCEAYAHWAVREGLAPAATVCLLMQNCPEYAAIWLGLTQAGCVVALLNVNLTGEALAHCIRTAASSHVIVSAALAPALLEIRNLFPESLSIYVQDGERMAGCNALVLYGEFDASPETGMAIRDTALLIYTSGTTGLPKACKISHGRMRRWCAWFAGMMGACPEDRLYNCLPMYHSVGGVVAIGAMLMAGGTTVLREKFSARAFWDDIVNEECTIFQYIGELCHYLTSQPKHPRERQHRLRLCCGNGLRGDVWETFKDRFAVPRILEFYAATEGNISLYNCEGRPGAIGRVPPFLAHRFPIAIIRYDVETGEPKRGDEGLCVACDVDEAGETIGKIFGSGSQQFEGYTDARASSGKLLHNVFEPGDTWFRTGDAMRKDAGGYYYFVDRLGDTFRWKGENVSTTEVAAVVSKVPGVRDAVVFGVNVAGHAGRAGMAAVTVNEAFSLGGLIQHLTKNLPDYARPRFLRVCATLDTTGTFKFNKQKLQSEGYSASSEPVWFPDYKNGAFMRWNGEVEEAVKSGEFRI
jgi:fatty-acyl-CoA synthase